MKLDKNASGTIDRDEFLSLPQVSSNPLATRMIAIFDEDGGGDVDFQEFVTGLSAFSSKGNKQEKLRFAFKVYDIDRDGYISNGELFIVLKMMVGNNLKDVQLQQIVDKTIMEADKDQDGKISFEEFTDMVENTDVSLSMTLTPSSTQQLNNSPTNHPHTPVPTSYQQVWPTHASVNSTPRTNIQNKALTFQPHGQQPPFPSGPTLIFHNKLTSANTSSPPSKIRKSLSFWTAVSWTG
ncbi:unnamed protein product [Penicillium egyptiacum]|uniref:Calcineurin subunit B n=1 Tax=Penicillium egyptiacum TaxID=1303716 RepID=A0A9W4KA49_9EURO|nr:unnamed protein product [Penicillium egyptiacum]